MYTVGGRFGSVFRVTNLNPTGPDSLADAVTGPNRIIVFTVSGIIDITGKKGGVLNVSTSQVNHYRFGCPAASLIAIEK